MQLDASQEAHSSFVMREEDDAIDLRPIFEEIWKAKKLISTGVVLFVMIAILANESLAKYWSEGHFKINNISPAAYRDVQVVFLDVDRFRSYAMREGLSDGESVAFIEGLMSMLPEQMERHVSMVKATSINSTKGRVNESEAGPVITGMDLRMSGPTPVSAQLRSRLFAEYFADTFIYVDLLKWLDSVRMDEEAVAYSSKLEAIRIQHSIDEANMRLIALHALMKRFPEALHIVSNQLISIDLQNDVPSDPKGGGEFGRRRHQGPSFEKFLSPAAQIFATERTILDGKIDLLKVRRKQKQSELGIEFCNQAAAFGVATSSGRELLKKLVEFQASFLEKKSAENAANREIVDEISHELERRQFGYASGLRFVSGPSLPEVKKRKSLAVIVLGAVAGGVFLTVAFVLLMSWWRRGGGTLSGDSASVDATN